MAVITLTSANDTAWLGQGPAFRTNNGPSSIWGGQTIDGAAGFDTLTVNESSTKASYFAISMAADGLVTFTSASGGSSKTLNFQNFEKISFWDVSMYLGSSANDTVIGGTGNDQLFGFLGNDTLDGGAGNDKMFGGVGDDTYILSAATDIVSEKLGEGTDTVQGGFSYSLADTDGAGLLGGNVENLKLTGTGAFTGTGNDLNNSLTGNGAANILTGGLGNDRLDGGLGADTLNGNAGNDTYVVDDIGDVVNELKGEGKDTVLSSISLTLGKEVEILKLTGSTAINGSGNTLPISLPAIPGTMCSPAGLARTR